MLRAAGEHIVLEAEILFIGDNQRTLGALSRPNCFLLQLFLPVTKTIVSLTGPEKPFLEKILFIWTILAKVVTDEKFFYISVVLNMS